MNKIVCLILSLLTRNARAKFSVLMWNGTWFLFRLLMNISTDTAKEIHSNDWDFEHRGKGAFDHSPGTLEPWLFYPGISLTAELTGNGPFWTPLLPGSGAPAMFSGYRAFMRGKSLLLIIFHLAIDFSRLHLIHVTVQKVLEKIKILPLWKLIALWRFADLLGSVVNQMYKHPNHNRKVWRLWFQTLKAKLVILSVKIVIQITIDQQLYSQTPGTLKNIVQSQVRGIHLSLSIWSLKLKCGIVFTSFCSQMTYFSQIHQDLFFLKKKGFACAWQECQAKLLRGKKKKLN